MIDDQIANDALRHILRAGDRSAALAGRESLDLHDCAALSLHLFGKLIESLFRLRTQSLLSGTEANLSIRNGLVLIKRTEGLLYRVEASARELNALLRLLR